MDSLIVVVNDLESSAVSRYAFIKSPVRIGRSGLNDLALAVPYVSGCHGVLQFDDSEVHYVDLGSLNGSALDGTRLQPNVPVLVGASSEISIGNLRMRCVRKAVTEGISVEKPVTQFSRHVSQLGLAVPVAPPPAQPDIVAPPEPARIEVVEEALANAAMELDLQYTSYRAAWAHLRNTVDQLLIGVEGPTRALLLSRLAEKYGCLAQEAEFLSLSGDQLAASPTPPGDGAAIGFLLAFAQSYLSARDQSATAESAEKLLARVAEVLETFGESYVELRKGYEEFGREMGVGVRTDGDVGRARDAQQLLGYLLDLSADGRSAELHSAFGDLMLHQVALLNGVVEGARGLLARLSPEAVAAESGQSRWPLKGAAQWRAFEACWHEIADDADGVPDALFGAEFARAYTAIVGRRAEGKDRSEKAPARSSPPPRPSRPQQRRS